MQTVTIEGDRGSRARGSTVARCPAGDWPRDAVLVAVRRDEDLLVPRGDLVLRPGDRVALLGPAGEGDRLRHFLAEAAGAPGRRTAQAAGRGGRDPRRGCRATDELGDDCARRRLPRDP